MFRTKDLLGFTNLKWAQQVTKVMDIRIRFSGEKSPR
jgi:hypothetical protein